MLAPRELVFLGGYPAAYSLTREIVAMQDEGRRLRTAAGLLEAILPSVGITEPSKLVSGSKL